MPAREPCRRIPRPPGAALLALALPLLPLAPSLTSRQLLPPPRPANPAIHVGWFSDWTQQPPMRACARAGETLGGSAEIRVVWSPPEGARAFELAEVRITALCGHLVDQVEEGPFELLPPDRRHPCPRGDRPPEALEWGAVRWSTGQWHNDEHRITATLRYELAGEPREEVVQQTFRLDNLVVRNITEEPYRQFIAWRAEPGQTVTLVCRLTAAPRARAEVTYAIYDVVSGEVVREETQIALVPGEDRFVWDGTRGLDGEPAPRGVYGYGISARVRPPEAQEPPR